MLKRVILILALVVGAFTLTHGTGQATPLGSSAQAQKAVPGQVQKAYIIIYRRRYRYRRFHRRRFFVYRYHRPRYRYYRVYRRRWR